MSKRIYILVVLLFLVFEINLNGEKDYYGGRENSKTTNRVKRDPEFGKIPLYFIPSKEGVNEKALFYAKTTRYTLWMTKEGLVFDSIVSQQDKGEKHRRKENDENKEYRNDHLKFKTRNTNPYKRDVSRLIFLNANKNPEIVPVNLTEHRVNYLFGKDPSKWKTNIQTSKALLYKGIYKNIDLKVYGVERQIEYDWVVRLGGNPEDVRFEYRNVEGTKIDKDGNLVIKTKFGKLTHKKPLSYQIINGKNVGIDVDFSRIDKNAYGFKVKNYNKDYELIIDPLIKVYSYRMVASLEDRGYGTAVDSNGSAYVTGYTYSDDFPLQNPFDDTDDTSMGDAFVFKLSPTGDSLLYSTYLGGSRQDIAYGIAVDSDGSAYIAGYTRSPDFPLQNPFDNTNGTFGDAFVTKLSPSGDSLLYSTYLGGGYDKDEIYGIAIDNNGSAYVTGYTKSSDFPLENSFDDSLGGEQDAFVTKLSPSGDSVLYSTYLGGSGEDAGQGIAVDSNGSAYVAGYTKSSDFSLQNAFDDSLEGEQDAFVTKLSPSGDSLLFSTYLGGSDEDTGRGIAVDSNSSAYVTGFTESSDFPLQSPIDDSLGGSVDAFITKFSLSGSTLSYSSYLGGSDSDRGYGIAVDSSGCAYVTGDTNSLDFSSHYTPSGQEPFVAKASQIGDSLSSVYVAVGLADSGRSIALGSDDTAYITAIDYIWYGPGWARMDDVVVIKLTESYEDNPPSITITSPEDGSTVSRIVEIQAEASDDFKVVKVDFYIDEELKHTATSEPYSYSWNTTSYEEGEHKIKAVAYDGKNQTAEDQISINVEYVVDNPPTVSITSPPDGSTVFGTGYIRAVATDDFEVSKVEIYIDGELESYDYSETDKLYWYTPSYTDGEHKIKAVAYDDYNQTGEDEITVNVDNTQTHIPESERNALIALYNSTNGDSWSGNTNWKKEDGNFNDPGTEGTWSGVTVELGHVVILWLSSNNLNGSIPSEIGNLTNLLELHLYLNQLIGSIPPEIGNLACLQTLDLWGNQLTGRIASEIGNLTSLYDNSSDFRYNALYTDDDSIRDFLNSKQTGGNWENTQTIAPTNLSATPTSSTSVEVTWTCIKFTSYGGGYRVFYSNTSGGPWTEAGTTTAKYITHFEVTELNAGTTYYFVVQTQTDPHVHNRNTVLSEYSEEASATPVIVTPPEIDLNRTQLSFGATTDEILTSSQSFIITNKGGGILDWSISYYADWLSCTPTSGTGNAVVGASVDPSGLAAGTYNDTITVWAVNASNSPQTIDVTLNIISSGASSEPFGSFDTPADGTTGITGAIPVTGWVLDDVEVTKVEIWRDPVGGEPTAANGLVYIGDSVFVEGARPDVEQLYPEYPLNYRAGWGYMMLTNFLPNQGNGTYVLHALAYDKEENSVELGTKTITCDNANATKPFGTIDTPGQGGEASGSTYVNFGWALTPQPNYIPEDGSTITVWIDGTPVGNPVYNQYRADIATLFPGYANSDGAVGFYYIDTTTYDDGVHTIAWGVEDSGGNTEGIGSRYFSIFNTGSADTLELEARSQRVNVESSLSVEFVNNLPVSFEPIKVRRGYKREADLGRVETEAEIMDVDYYGAINIDIREVERVEIDLGEGGQFRGYLIVGDQLRRLPIGSTLDAGNGIFSWQPGPGFIGYYDFVFIKTDKSGGKKIRIKARILPKHLMQSDHL